MLFAGRVPYKTKITTDVKDNSGNALANTYTTDNGYTIIDYIAPTVSSVSPADSATDQAKTTTVSVTFDEALNTSTVTTNTGSTSCSGSFQVSSDNFSTCVQMNASPAASNSDKTFTITPASDLTSETTYKIKITTSVTDTTGNALASASTTSNGFTIVDYAAPTVSSTSPADSATSVARDTTISVTFDEAMNTSTVTTNTSNTSCSGSFQVSSDNFSTCVQMSGSPSASNSDKTFTITPASNLSYNTTYKIKITTNVADTTGNALASANTTSNGFTITQLSPC